MATLETEVEKSFGEFEEFGVLPDDERDLYLLTRYAKDIICNEIAVKDQKKKKSAVKLLTEVGQAAASVVVWGLRTEGHDACYRLLENYIDATDTFRLDIKQLIVPIGAATSDEIVAKQHDALELLIKVVDTHFPEVVKDPRYNRIKSSFYDFVFSMLNNPVQKKYAEAVIEAGLIHNPHDKVILFSLVRSLDNEIASDYCINKLKEIGPVRSTVEDLLRQYHTKNEIMSERAYGVLLDYGDSPLLLHELFKSLSNRDYKDKDLALLKKYRSTKRFADSFESVVRYLPEYQLPRKEIIKHLTDLFRGMRPNKYIVRSFFNIMNEVNQGPNGLFFEEPDYKCRSFIVRKLNGWKMTSIKYSAKLYT